MGNKGVWYIGHRQVAGHEIWEPQPPETLQACTGIALPFSDMQKTGI